MKSLLLLFSVLSFQFFNISTFVIDGPSMEPALQNGDIILINENLQNGGLNWGDIVVFALESDPDFFYVKRIVGMPGEKLHIKKDGIYIDDENGDMKKRVEPYIETEADTVLKSEAYLQDPQHTYVIPENKYFVLGDNRSHSLDSRYFRNPFIKINDIKGKYLFKLISYE